MNIQYKVKKIMLLNATKKKSSSKTSGNNVTFPSFWTPSMKS